MPVDLTAKVATELVQRQALLVLFDKLNTTITNSQTAWTTGDNTFWGLLGRGTPGWTVETIPNDNFFPGTIPSLINSIIGIGEVNLENYPNVCTLAYRGDPKRSNDDLGEDYTLTLQIEVIVKSLKSEVEVNTRIQKTLEACHLTLWDNRTLYNTINGLLPPVQTIGDVFAVRNPNDKYQVWYFQGGSLEYKLDKYVDLVY